MERSTQSIFHITTYSNRNYITTYKNKYDVAKSDKESINEKILMTIDLSMQKNYNLKFAFENKFIN
jgi:hypothetical protein